VSSEDEIYSNLGLLFEELDHCEISGGVILEGDGPSRRLEILFLSQLLVSLPGHLNALI